MKMPNLFWRGMILTMIPLVFQLTIIAFLAHYLLTIKNEIVLESRSQEIIARAFVLNRDAMETIYNLTFAFDVVPGAEGFMSKLPSRSLQPLETLNKNLQGLLNLARVDAESAQKMSNLVSCHKQLIRLVGDAHHQTFKTYQQRREQRDIFFQRFLECGREYANATSAIVELEESRQAKRPELIKALVTKVWETLFIALAVSSILAAVLGYFYIHLVKRPLKLTLENGIRLAKGQPLTPAIGGTDELSTLDRLLHSTASALEKVEQDEKTLVENAADLICSLSENGAFISANPFAIRMLGWTPEALEGRNLNELTIPEETFACDQKLREARGSADISVFDLRLQTMSKEIIDTRWSCFWSDAQKVFFCVAHDITETKNAERIKQDLVDMISHDLRSPLTSVSISLAILSRGAKGELPLKEKEKIALAGETVDKLIELVNDLLDFQKLNAANMQLEYSSLELQDMAENAAQASQSHADRKGINIEITGDEASMRGDKHLITQALISALENAIKASPEGSTIKIEISANGDTAQLRIVDLAEGLTDDEIAQFAQNIPTQKLGGSGNRSLLKFAICKQIIEAHGGTVSLSNVKPQGCSFSIRVPLSV